MPAKLTTARIPCSTGRRVFKRWKPFQANHGSRIAILTDIRQNTISNVDRVSDSTRTDVCVDENSTIEKTAIRTPLRTVGEFGRGIGMGFGVRVVEWNRLK